ncbi:hypothetical protein LTR08_003277 [Meristemomyces frigidus]|nr:hypothetical protein LTR08_003277 [Meristemomyces frigidus]
MDRKPPSDALVIGIDFGTTFSGVAAAYSANPEAADEINVIKTWPGGNNVTSDKVPSEVTYGQGSGGAATKLSSTPTDTFDFAAFNAALDASQMSEGLAAVNSDCMRWGFQIRPDEPRLQCLKLFLDPSQPFPSYVSLDYLEKQLKASGKNVGTAVAEYLKALFSHTKEILSRRYGEHFVASTKLQVVLTVPAVWSDAAKDATLKAAEAAGMGNSIELISEPEAAAVYALQAIQPNHLSVGHNFVVVDAGGGTVDLITYKIKQLTPLRLEEIVPGSGSCCGSAFLNVRFQEFVRNKLGNTEFEDLCLNKPRSWSTALKYFEDYVKRNFNPEEHVVFNVPFPGVPEDEAAGIEHGYMCMTSAEVGSLFKPIIMQIIALVEGQTDEVRAKGQTVNGIILVGGFGQSECLLKCLRAKFSKPGQKLEVMQPVNAWTAVVRGAVLRGLEGAELILNRKSRRHYGVQCRPLFDARVHSASNKVWDDNTEQWLANNHMAWYINKGDTVSSTEPILFPFYSTASMNMNSTLSIHELIVCDDDVAPSTFDKNPGSATQVMCKMIVNLRSVPRHLWKEHVNSTGTRYKRLDLVMGMQVESGRLRFDFRVDGVVYEKVMATFE